MARSRQEKKAARKKFWGGVGKVLKFVAPIAGVALGGGLAVGAFGVLKKLSPDFILKATKSIKALGKIRKDKVKETLQANGIEPTEANQQEVLNSLQLANPTAEIVEGGGMDSKTKIMAVGGGLLALGGLFLLLNKNKKR